MEQKPIAATSHLDNVGFEGDLDFVVAHMRQGIWRLDAQGRVVAANPYLAAWLEVSLERLIGMPAKEFAPEAELLEEGVFEAEFASRTGIERLARVTSRLSQDAGGRVLGALQLITDITAEHAIQSRLVLEVQHMARLAGTDPLTGLPNRRAFDIVLQGAQGTRAERPFGLLIVDVDEFKTFNDVHGHAVGDVVLREFAHKLQASVRESDFVARTGGDEFGVVLPGIGAGAFEEMTQRLERLLDFDVPLEGKRLRISGSVGGAHSSLPLLDLAEEADRAMYAHKRSRKADGSQARNDTV